jgi:toxin ParE1/3/4
MRRLIISDDAYADLEDIGRFIEQDNVDAAILFVKRLKERCHELIPFPGIGRRRDEIEPGYRSIAEGEYVIFYREKPDDIVEILRIVHGKRDLGNVLRK